jgi:hypothetical protein
MLGFSDVLFQVMNTSDAYANFTGLEFFVMYNVTVDCIPLVRSMDGNLQVRGFWSDRVHLTLRTQAGRMCKAFQFVFIDNC